jgi:hypothetical protein
MHDLWTMGRACVSVCLSGMACSASWEVSGSQQCPCLGTNASAILATNMS